MAAGHELVAACGLVMQDLGPVVGLVVVRLNCLPNARQVFPKTENPPHFPVEKPLYLCQDRKSANDEDGKSANDEDGKSASNYKAADD
jgi:hypothetical protein